MKEGLSDETITLLEELNPAKVRKAGKALRKSEDVKKKYLPMIEQAIKECEIQALPGTGAGKRYW